MVARVFRELIGQDEVVAILERAVAAASTLKACNFSPSSIARDTASLPCISTKATILRRWATNIGKHALRVLLSKRL